MYRALRTRETCALLILQRSNRGLLDVGDILHRLPRQEVRPDVVAFLLGNVLVVAASVLEKRRSGSGKSIFDRKVKLRIGQQDPAVTKVGPVPQFPAETPSQYPMLSVSCAVRIRGRTGTSCVELFLRRPRTPAASGQSRGSTTPPS